MSFLTDSSKERNTLYFTNRFVDVLFFVDMCLQFFIMYPSDAQKAGRGGWVKDPKMIVRHYLQTWFVLDAFSLFPSLIDLVMDALETTNDDCPSQSGATEDTGFLSIMRVIRVLRLIKLIRLVRASRLIKRWTSRIRVSYQTASFLKCFLGVLFSTHLFACVFVLQTTFADKLVETWRGAWNYCHTDPSYDWSLAEGDSATFGS